MKPKILHFRIHTPNLLKEIADCAIPSTSNQLKLKTKSEAINMEEEPKFALVDKYWRKIYGKGQMIFDEWKDASKRARELAPEIGGVILTSTNVVGYY